MSDDLAKLMEKAEFVMAPDETYRKKIEEPRYVLTGPLRVRLSLRT